MKKYKFIIVVLCALAFYSSAFAQIIVPDNGSGTADLPVPGHPYTTFSFDTTIFIIDGLPLGTCIKIDAEILPLNINNISVGETTQIDSFFDVFTELSLTGEGSLQGYQRDITINFGTGSVHWADRTLENPLQIISADMNHLQMQITGDPDFDLLRITAGNDFGLPSPGETTLTRLANDNWAVDSFFDITYRIDFVGAPGGALAGLSGSTTGAVTMAIPEPLTAIIFAIGSLILRKRK